MATQNHVVVPNFAALSPTGGSVFNQIWKLTRAMKKAGWKYIASSNGSAKEPTSGAPTYDPELDLWGAGTVSNVGGAAAVIGTPARGRVAVTGLTGIVAADKGRFLHISGSSIGPNNHYHQIEEVTSSTAVKIDARTFAVGADAGPLTWEVIDPLGESYPPSLSPGLGGSNGWWAARGPSMLKIPITAVPTPGPSGSTFVRGENVVQATTGAEGEILGFVHDGATTGYLVISPRLRGTGSGVYGWDTTNNVVGDTSGATVAQNGTALEYRHEIVIGKTNTTTHGFIWIGCFEPVGEASDMFSAKVTTATAAFPPGDTGGGMTFPNFAWVVLGTSTTLASSQQWIYATSSDANGNAQIMCADAIEEEDWSSDGSWTIAMATLSGTTASGCTAGDHTGFSFQRCDDSEDGDLQPYVTVSPNSADWGSGSRTANGATPSAPVLHLFSTSSSYFSLSTNTALRGWLGRGMVGDSASYYSGFAGAILFDMAGISTASLMGTNPAWVERQRTALVPTKVREPIWVALNVASTSKMRKGTMRWFGVVQGGESGDTYDSKKWIQLSSKTAPFVGGPWDGSTTPILWT